jgi:hypothetical protein
MNQYEIAIIALLALEAITLFILWRTHLDRQFWQAMWTRDAAELILHKRNASLRDSKTGRFIKKDAI